MTKNITVTPAKTDEKPAEAVNEQATQEQTTQEQPTEPIVENVITTDTVTAVVQPPVDADKEQAFPNTTDTRTVADVDKEIKQANAETLANRIPSNWVITPGEGDDIVAVNNITKKTFEGSVADFNSILRG